MTAFAKKKSSFLPPDDRPSLAKPTFMEQYGVVLYLFLAFFIPFILMFFALKVAGVSPFGTNQMLVTDLWHQYYPFLVDYQDKLQKGGSLLWTWKSGGGTNYIGLMAYYLASPLNFFSVFVPADKLREFLYVITCVKIGLAGFFYALFLKITFKRRDASITAFGILYALCSFIMGYYWNVIWLDTIALLPMVIAGTFALLRHGKFKLYIISLARSILANYYIGLFTCAFILLVSIGYCIVEYKGWKDLIIQFFKMAGCSLIAIMMTAVLTLPTYFALGLTHSSDNSFPQNFAINIGSSPDLAGVLEAIGKIIANSVAFIKPTSKEGLPNIYCGVITIFLGILFFFCGKIKKRERIVCGSMLLFFVLSFIIRQLDFLWHGMHFPNMLPHRFSFLYSFLLIYMAFRVFMYIDEIKLTSVISAILVFAVYLGVASASFDGEKVQLSAVFDGDTDPVLFSAFIAGILALWILLYSLRDSIPKLAVTIGVGVIGVGAAVLVFIYGPTLNSAIRQDEKNGFYIFIAIMVLLLTAAAVILVSGKTMNKDHQMTKVMLTVLLLGLAMIEGLFSAASGVKTVTVTDGKSYPLGTTDTANVVSCINNLEKDKIDLARAEQNKYHTLNDNALNGFNGISMFSSMVNKDVTAYMEKFGICGWVSSNRYTYQESSPFTNLMLNIKYLIAPYGAYLDKSYNKLIYQSGNVKLMENQWYLPQGFMVSDDLLSFSVDGASTNPMDNQIRIFNLATGLKGDIYEYIEPSSASSDSDDAKLTPDKSLAGHYNYSATNSSNDYDVSYIAPRDGVALAYFTSSNNTDNMSIRVNGSEVISYYIKRPFIMMVGDVKKGDTITLHSTVKNTSGSITSYCAMFNDTLFKQGYQKLSQSVLNATEVSDTKIAGTITAAQDGLFYTSISYSDGWKAYVDGEAVELTPVCDAMVAFKLSAGTHEIELRYMPHGFIPGVICSLLAILLFIALILLAPKREKIFAQIKSKLPEKALSSKEAVPTDDISEDTASDDSVTEDAISDDSSEEEITE